MRNLDELEYHGKSEEVVKILCNKTQSANPLFFRVLIGYYFSKVASMMRAKIDTHDRGIIPINMYAMNLATSGQGKGHSTNIVEEKIINQFKELFLEETFPAIGETNLNKLAVQRANRKTITTNIVVDPNDEYERVKKEFDNLGVLAFSFDSGTTAAVKQMRHKLLMANAGSMNMEIDEIGSNLLGQVDVLNTFLELYDVGKVKQKLTKNTSENVRSEEIDGKTPTNMMLFGTPSKLLSGGRVEEEFYSMLETGYARRCFFGYSRANPKQTKLTPEQVFDLLTDTSGDVYLEGLSTHLGQLADRINFDKKLTMDKAVSLLLIEYRLYCEELSESYAEHEEIRKAEMSHRYFKALKLAGAYAFIDGSSCITEDHLYSAIKLAEESGEAFTRLLTRDRNYVKLAKYIAEIGREVTHVDLVEDLPFYKGAEAAKRELMTLAIAYGYKNNIIIKRMFNDGIEFLKGESLQKTDLNKVLISYGTEMAANYSNEEVPFDQLHKLTQLDGYHWVAHHLLDGYRKEENALPGFNLVVVDVDGGTEMNTAKMLLKDYKCMFYTTKRHSATNNRYRIIFPISYTLRMDSKDYKEFMSNIYEWLPFSVDTQTNQRARKWMSHNGIYEYVDGEMLDALLFIPKTTKNEERKKIVNDQQSLSNIERWFVNNTGIGNRSNQLIKYALLLVDSGQSLDTVRNNVLALNNKLQDKMEETEVLTTILVSATRAIATRDNA
jgi:hypothetical protein